MPRLKTSSKHKQDKKQEIPRTTTAAGMNPAKSEPTKRPAPSDEAPQQGPKKHKGKRSMNPAKSEPTEKAAPSEEAPQQGRKKQKGKRSMNPAKSEPTKKAAPSEKAPQQGRKRRKGKRGWSLTALSPSAEQQKNKLLLPATPCTGQDPPRNPAIKRTAEASPHQANKLMKTSEQHVSVAHHATHDRETNLPGFKMPSIQRNAAVKRRASLSPKPRLVKKAKSCSAPAQRNSAPEPPPVQRIDSAAKRARHYLAHLGVQLLKEETVRKMVSLGSQDLGAGAFGSCCKGADPESGKELVVKTFLQDALRSLVTEAKYLQQLQGQGMQRLVGVCVETRQLVTRFAGQTAVDYFSEDVCFTHTLSVILQVAETVRRVNEAGYAHNDIKNNNVCVKQATRGPKATVIDLGLARKIGTRGLYDTSQDAAERQRKFPWIAPELLLDSNPCSAASDVYSVGFFILCVPGIQDRPIETHAMWSFRYWLWNALQPVPEERPSLDVLIELVKVLIIENASRTSALPNR